MTEEPFTRYHRHRFPAEIIAHAVWLYYRFPLSLRDVEDLLAERGIEVSFQTVSEWVVKFGLKFAYQLRRRSSGNFADKWHLDERVPRGSHTAAGASRHTLIHVPLVIRLGAVPANAGGKMAAKAINP